MTIIYNDIAHRTQPPLDCSEIKDLRGQFFYNRLIINCENADFSGCVLLHCYPSGFINAIEVNPAQSPEDVTLVGADLSGANLEGANLEGAYLSGVNLVGVNLVGAYLGRANLQGANLIAANLQAANLEEASLQGADLRYAELQGANLSEANLSEAKLLRAKIWDAIYNSETNFEDSDITQEQLNSMVFVEDDED